MTRIKLCGLSRPCDIEAVNGLKPDYIGFVFSPKSKRYVSHEQAAVLKRLLSPDIPAVGVFVNEDPQTVAGFLRSDVIDIAQLHGSEDQAYLNRLRQLTDKPLIRAFHIQTAADLEAAKSCGADAILLDSGAGTGTVFDWNLLKNMERPYFLAGGLSPDNVADAVRTLHPFAVDVSSGIETGGVKDPEKMAAFVAAVRKEDRI